MFRRRPVGKRGDFAPRLRDQFNLQTDNPDILTARDVDRVLKRIRAGHEDYGIGIDRQLYSVDKSATVNITRRNLACLGFRNIHQYRVHQVRWLLSDIPTQGLSKCASGEEVQSTKQSQEVAQEFH
jgi:hypothetical protein